MPKDLEEAVAAWKSDAVVARRVGAGAVADALDRCAREVQIYAPWQFEWITERQAHDQRGRSVTWLRAHFAEWKRIGHARLIGRGIRRYRSYIVPFRRAPTHGELLAGRLGREAAERDAERL